MKISETCTSKTLRSDNIISLKDTFSVWKKNFILSQYPELSALAMFIFSAFQGNYNPISQNDMANIVFFIDFDGANSQITLSK